MLTPIRPRSRRHRGVHPRPAPGHGAPSQPAGAVPVHPPAHLEHRRRPAADAARGGQGHRQGGGGDHGRHQDSRVHLDRDPAAGRLQTDHQRHHLQREHPQAGAVDAGGGEEVSGGM